MACLIAERVLGVRAEPWDVGARQGAVDAILHYPDGRAAALEYSALGLQRALELDSRLSAQGFAWPLPGDWWWTVAVGHPHELNRLRSIFDRVVLLCEEQGVARPESLPWVIRETDQDLIWLLTESSSSLFGHPGLAARDANGERSAMVVPTGDGGAVDTELSGLRPALLDRFESTHLRSRLAKLLSHESDERHLFVAIHETGLPPPVFHGLAFGDQLPPEPPPLPNGVTHLWLAPNYSSRVLLWARHRWHQHEPYDSTGE